MAETTYSAFENLNLSDARMKNETREQYKSRLKINRKIVKLYSTVGRDTFQQMFPNGVGEALTNNVEQTKEIPTKGLGESK